MKEQKFNIHKFIVGKYVKEESIIWPREIKIAKKLTNAYPNQDFLQTFELTFSLNSLAWFLTARGCEMITREYNLFNAEEKKSVEAGVSDKKVGEDKIIPKQAGGILEFVGVETKVEEEDWDFKGLI